MNNILERNPELLDLMDKNEIELVRLKPNSKVPIDTNWNQETFPKNHFISHGGNLGFKISKGWACIDIDGCKTNSSEITPERDMEIKRESQAWFAKHLFKLFPNALHVRTASGAYHIILKSKKQYDDDHEVSNTFMFPQTFEIKELRDKSLKGCLEVFTKDNNRQIVMPGSTINGETYTILASGVNSFLEVEEHDDINKTISDFLISQFFYEELVPTNDDNLKDLVIDQSIKSRDLPKHHLDDLSDLIIQYLKHCDASNSKHKFTLALGGYFFKYKITPTSLSELADLIIEKVPYGFFKSNKDFKETLLKTYNRTSVDSVQGGLSCYDFVSDLETPDHFFGKLIFYMGGNLNIYPTVYHGSNYQKIILDYKNRLVSVCNCTKVKDDEGNTYEKETSSRSIFGAIPTKIEITNNFANKDAPPRISATFYDDSNDFTKITGGDVEELIERAKKHPCIITSNNNSLDIMRQIVKRFKSLGLLKVTERSTIPGIFYNEDRDGLLRYDIDGEPVPIRNVSSQELTESLKFLKKIMTVYPTEETKFTTICRFALILPFTKILKDIGQTPRYFFLGGVGGTLKTTLSEMMLSFYIEPTTSGKFKSVYGGGAFSSPYQVGEKFGKSTYGFVVNEPATAFFNQDLIEILKNAIESDVAREIKSEEFYSYQSAIFCTNVDLPISDALERRFVKLYFTNGDIPSKLDLDNIKTLLNKKGKKNYNFKKLRPIGDFCVYFLHNNPQVLMECSSIDELVDLLIDKMEKSADIALDWLREGSTEFSTLEVNTQIQDDYTDNLLVNSFLQHIRVAYNYQFKVANNRIIQLNENDDLPSVGFEKNNVVDMTNLGLFSFVYPHSNKFCYVPTGEIKKWYIERYNGIFTSTEFTRQLKDLASFVFDDEYIDKNIKSGQKPSSKNVKERFDGKRPSGIKIGYDLLVSLLNYEYVKDKGEDDYE